MAIVRLDTAASVDATTQTFSVSAGTDRMLVACIGAESSAPDTSVTSVDYGGQAMVEAIEIGTADTGFAYGNSIWYLLETGIDAASTSVITPTFGGTAPDDVMIHAISYENVEQAGGATTNPATASFELNEATPVLISTDLTETDEGCVVAIRGSGNVATHTWGGTVPVGEQTDQASLSSGSSMADRLSTTSGNVDVEGTSSNQNRGAQVAASFAPASGVSDIDATEPLAFSQSDATLSGIGTLAKTEALVLAQTGDLTGTGALTKTEALILAQTAALTGTGALAGSKAITFSELASLVATGALTASEAFTFAETVTLAGTGVLTATENLAFSELVALVGSGALIVSEIITFGNVVTISIVDTQIQDQFRFGADDGSESAHGWIAAQNVNINQSVSIPAILRIQVNNYGDFPSQQMKLQYKITTQPDSEYRDVPVAD